MATVDQLRADIGATIILLLTVQAVDPTDGTTSTWRFSTHQDLPPDTPFKYHPYLELSAPYVAALASGAALSGPSRLDYGEFRIANPGAGDAEDDYGDRPLDDLATLELSGQPLSVDIVGRTAEGEWVAYADREAWIPAGIVGETPAWDPAGGITLPILEPGDKLTRRLYPPYRGLGKCVHFNGSTTQATVSGSQWQAPGSFTLQAFCWYGQQPSGAARGIFAKGAAFDLPIDVNFTNSTPAQLAAYVETSTASATALASPSDTSPRLVWINVTYDSSTGVISAWVDEDAASTATVTGGGAADVSTETIYLGGEPGNQPGYGPIAAWRLWDRVVPRTELIGYQSGPLPADAGASHIADWRGDYNVGLTKIYDYGPSRNESTGTSALDATLTNGTAAHTLEGGPELGGTERPVLIGRFGNIPAIPIAPEFGLYQLAAHPSPPPELFMDKRADPPYTLHEVTGEIAKLFTAAAAPGTGEYVYFWPLSIVRIVNRSEGGQLTADGWGAGLWGRAYYGDGVDGYVALPSAIDATMNGAAWTLMVVCHPRENTYVFSRGTSGGSGVRLQVVTSSSGSVLTLTYEAVVGMSPALLTLVVPIPSTDDPLTVVVRRNYASGVPSYRWRVSINGRHLSDVSAGGQLPSTTGGADLLRLGTSYEEGSVSAVAIWNREITDAEVEEYYTDLDEASSGLRFLYRNEPSFADTVTTWPNRGSFGTANATVSGGYWGGGVPARGTIDGTRWLLDRVGVLAADTDLESALATVADAAVSAYYGTPPPGDTSPPQTGETRLPGQQLPVVAAPDGEPTAQLMIDRLRIAQHCYLIYDRGTGLYTLVQLVDPSTIIPSAVLDADDLLSTPEPVEVLRPSGLYRVGWGPVAIAMTDEQFAASVSDEGRAYYSRTLRYATRAVDASAYPLSPPTYSVNATFRHESEAVSEAVRIAGILGTRRVAYRAPLRYGLLQGAPPGAGRTLSHRRLPADLPAIVLSTEDVATRGSLILLG